MAEIDCLTCDECSDFDAYVFDTGNRQGYSAERTTPVRRQMVGDDVVVPFIASDVNMKCFRGVACKTFTEV